MANTDSYDIQLLSSDKTAGFKDCIANNIPSRAFRYAAENKNVLSMKGAMYIGSGETRTNVMMLESSNDPAVTNVSFKTRVLLPPTTQGFYIMACSVDSNGEATVGWIAAPSGWTSSFETSDSSVG